MQITNLHSVYFSATEMTDIIQGGGGGGVLGFFFFLFFLPPPLVICYVDTCVFPLT